MDGTLPAAEVLFDGIFDPAIQVVGKTVTAATGLAVLYYKLRSAVIGRDQAVYSIGTHLPQAFDRAAVATLRLQRQQSAVLELALCMPQTKQRLQQRGLDKDTKIQLILEGFTQNVAFVLVSNHIFSCLGCALAIRQSLVVLDYIRAVHQAKQQQEEHHSSWGSLLQGAAQSAVLRAIQSSLGVFGSSPFDRDENSGLASDAHISAALECLIPRLAEIALQVAVAEIGAAGMMADVRNKFAREVFLGVLRRSWTVFEELVELKAPRAFARGEFTCDLPRSSAVALAAPEVSPSTAPAALHIHASMEAIDRSGHVIREAEVDVYQAVTSSSASAHGGRSGGAPSVSMPAACIRDMDRVLRSPEFAELSVANASEMFDDLVSIVDTQFLKVSGYDTAEDSASLLGITIAFAQTRREASDISVPVPDYVRFFCEEMVRSTANAL
jgi:hypothetical protein